MSPRRAGPINLPAAALGLLLVAAVCGAATAATPPKVLCLGFDGMDPQLLDRFRADGSMPNFDALIARGDYRPLGTAIPPQSPVAWSNFITGMDPGGHGIFDFIHRNPATLTPYLSAAQAMESQRWWKIGPWKFPRDESRVENLRDGAAFWQLLDAAGVPATVFKMPANFPPVECEAHTLSGMGTPDILGTYGIYSYFTEDVTEEIEMSGGRHVPVAVRDGRVWAELIGPANTYRAGDPESRLPFEVVVDREHGSALFDVDGERFLLQQGEWSDWVTLRFRLVPALKTVRGVCRFYLKEASPTFKLYVTPVNLDPAAPEMPISTPADWSRELAAALGPFYTQGLPDDTKALEEGVFDDDDYVAQSTLVFEELERQLSHELARFAAQKSGFLFFYFNSPDQTCHTFWRNMDHGSPLHDPDDERHEHRIRDVYRACDRALGLALERADDETLVLVLSDHGFAPYHRSFHVNRWLYDHGYLVLQPGVAPGDVTYLSGIDWDRTRAYAIGINGLYLNLQGREARGIVDAGAGREALLRELVAGLEAAVDPVTGRRAIKYAYRTDEVYHGQHAHEAPDIVLGYYRGYRGSNESALGEVPASLFVDNMMKWSGDHCMAADEVPGIIISSRRIDKTDPTLLDLAPTFLSLFGIAPLPEMVGSPLFTGGR